MSDQTHLSPVSLSSREIREFDIVIFGASGFVGYYAIKDLYTSIRDNPKEYSTLKWAVAGRTLAKLEQTLSDLEEELQVDLSTIPRIIADVSAPGTVSSLVTRTRVLLNAVGPYMELGRAVVDACLSSGTHHLDVSAELQFIELTQVECHQEAINSEALVISACGWASLIPEMAVALARKHFDGTLHSVETFVDMKVGKHSYSLHDGTFRSIMYSILRTLDLVPIRRRLYSEILTAKLPSSGPRFWRYPMRFSFFNDIKGIVFPIPVPDPSTISRGQHYNYQTFGERPLHYQGYYRLRMLKILNVAPVGCFMWCSCGRALLKRHIGKFTCGFITKKGPSRQQVNEAKFSLRVIARGWPKEASTETSKVESIEEVTKGEKKAPRGMPKKKLLLKITGGDPPYAVTACCLVQAGLTIIMDGEKMPRGGVLTPGSAFRGTSLWERMQGRGIGYQIIEGGASDA